jgi:hypothetical protein
MVQFRYHGVEGKKKYLLLDEISPQSRAEGMIQKFLETETPGVSSSATVL